MFVFSENLACFVSLLPLFWDLPFCLSTDDIRCYKSLLFLMYLNVLAEELSSKTKLFVDDTSMVAEGCHREKKTNKQRKVVCVLEKFCV